MSRWLQVQGSPRGRCLRLNPSNLPPLTGTFPPMRFSISAELPRLTDTTHITRIRAECPQGCIPTQGGAHACRFFRCATRLLLCGHGLRNDCHCSAASCANLPCLQAGLGCPDSLVRRADDPDLLG